MKRVPLLAFLLRHYIMVLVVIVVVAALSFGFWQRGNQSEPLAYALVQKGTVRSVVSTSGVLAGKDNVSVKFKTSGKLDQTVRVGDTVVAGLMIAHLDTKDLSIALQQAWNDWRAKQASAEKAVDDVKDHDKDETYTQKETRTKAQTARDSAFDVAKAAQLSLDNATLVSPITGVVTQADPLPGQYVVSADTIAHIVDWSQVFFDADVDEADIGKVAVGQEVTVTLNAYASRNFTGVVKEILPTTKTASSGATVVTVRIELTDSSIEHIVGLNGQATIVVAQANDVVTVPPETIVDNHTVYIPLYFQTGVQVQTVTVKIGLTSDTAVEIQEGLSVGQQVVKNPAAVKAMTNNNQSLFARFLRILPGRQ